ncbi:MAG: CRISPR system precrRNA processing endoribonuclease RAMP protein Cas6, partial [Desulfobacca sp.]
MEFWQEIPFVRLVYTYRCQEELQLPPYKGSALRGALGHALKKVTCALRRATCAECLLRQSCVYVYVFETPPPPGSQRLRLYPAAPHPFVLRPPADQQQRFAPGEELRGELLLIGRAIDYLPYFVYTLEVLGQAGLGRGRGRAELIEVRELASGQQPVVEIYDANTGLLSAPRQAAWRQSKAAAGASHQQPLDLSLEFLTPVRLKY